jgi:hypothetical protein
MQTSVTHQGYLSIQYGNLSDNTTHDPSSISDISHSQIAPPYPLIGTWRKPTLPLGISPQTIHGGRGQCAQLYHPPIPAFGPANSLPSLNTPNELIPIVFPVFAATTDILSLSRYYLFANGIIFGIHFTSAKTQALINGDLSNTIIRSASVHASTLWGLALIARSHGNLLDDTVQSQHYSAAYMALQIPPKTRESAVDDIQARAVLAIYDFNKKNIVSGCTWLREAAWSIRQAGLQFTLPDRTSGIRNDASLYVAATAQDQERDALCYLVCVDVGARMLINAESSLGDDVQHSVAQLLVSTRSAQFGALLNKLHSCIATNTLITHLSLCSASWR